MNEPIPTWTCAVLICVAFAVGLAFGVLTDNGYMQGQIDALTGKVKYELREHADGTKTWEATNAD